MATSFHSVSWTASTLTPEIGESVLITITPGDGAARTDELPLTITLSNDAEGTLSPSTIIIPAGSTAPVIATYVPTQIGQETATLSTATPDITLSPALAFSVSAAAKKAAPLMKASFTATPPGPPMFALLAGDGWVAVSVTAPTDTGSSSITGFPIYAGTVSGQTSQTLVTTLSQPGTYTIQGLTNGTQEYVTVGATNSAGTTFASEKSTTPTNAASAAVNVGSLSYVTAGSNVVLSVSAPATGGSGSGYSYSIYRCPNPTLGAVSSTLLTTTTSMPFTDTLSGNDLSKTWFYWVIAQDSSGKTTPAQPANLNVSTGAAALPVSVRFQSARYAVVCIGDELTGDAPANGKSPVSSLSDAMNANSALAPVAIATCAQSGFATADWLPSGTNYTTISSAMTALLAASPKAQPVFSIMLGLNDSRAAVSVTTFYANYSKLILQLIRDFPSAKILLQMTPFYSANAKGGLTGLQLLNQYNDRLADIVTLHDDNCILGDLAAPGWFAQNYSTTMQADTGTYWRPNATGTAYLGGTLWYNALFAALA